MRGTKHNRRTILTTIGAGTLTALSGCLNLSSTTTPQTSYACELEPKEPVSELPNPTIGADDPVVTIESFEDYSCGHCRRFHLNHLAKIKDEYINTGDEGATSVQIKHYDSPMPVDEWSIPVANAARAVQDAHGDEAFYTFAKSLFESQDEYNWERIGKIASNQSDLDPCNTISAASNERYASVIEADKQTGKERNIPGTPTVFINGEMQSDWSYEALKNTIDSLL